MPKVRVRIAPSPTGFAHIGTAYMALFNWAFAKKNQGIFTLRLEDTDIKRHVEKAESAIYDALDWLDLSPDESPIIGGEYAPYRQSERLDIYKKYADQLEKSKKAYRQDGALWLSIPQTGKFSWDDQVRGFIEFDVQNLKDWVIIKSDGFPTYNFANVIDDSLMNITHIIRGEEHISNTPLQLSAYQALGFKTPLFAHLPVLRNSSHQKLSKRRDPVSLEWFRGQGYLPEAILNFLSLQGWSHPQQKDIFTKEEFIKYFELNKIKTSAPVFDFNKLDWINGEYIRQKSDSELIKTIKNFSKLNVPEHLWPRIIPLVKVRIKKFSDIDSWIGFFITDPQIDPTLFTPEVKSQSIQIIDVLKNTIWKTENIQTNLLDLVDGNSDWKRGSFFMNLRLAITGQKISPPLIESMEILGKEKCINRIKHVPSCFK